MHSIRSLAIASAVVFLAACGSAERKSTSEDAASPEESEIARTPDAAVGESEAETPAESSEPKTSDVDDQADSAGSDDVDDADSDSSDRDAAKDEAAEEQAAAEQAAAEKAAAEKAAAEKAAAEKAAAEKAAAAKAAAEAEARRPKSFSFQIDSPEAASIQEFFDRGCARMGDWVVEPPDAMIVHLEKEISAAVASNKAFSGCTASYLVLAHDDLEILPVCQNGGKAFMVAVDDAIPHVYLIGASGRVSDDSVLRDDRRHRLADELWFNANAKGPTGRSLRPGDRLLVWDRWDNSRDWTGWVIVLED
ncbi:MAG: hypothetical protein ACYTDE_10185 [Planctomycetota bacterium]